MKINSKLFDSVRIRPRHAAQRHEEVPVCDWAGCERPGRYRAPKRGGGEQHFCLEHVRLYNQSFDYFAEGADKDTDPLGDMLRRAARTGERPTWSMGANPDAARAKGPYRHRPKDFSGKRFADPLNLFARLDRFQGKANPIRERERAVTTADRRALEVLGLEAAAKTDDIKKAYKALVKKHHPDANGGDRASEDRLRAIIAAYTHLKKKGFA